MKNTSSKVPRSGTYHQKSTASCEAPQRNHKQQGSAKRDLPSETHCKLRSSAAVGTDNHPTTTVPRSGTDISTMILRTVHRSRFAEPRESVSVFAYPQRRSFGACSGFQIDTCPIGTRHRSYCHTVTEVARLRSTAQQRNHKQQNKLRRLWRLVSCIFSEQTLDCF